MTDSVEQYILQFPQEIQEKLFAIKQVIEKTAPMLQSRIAWNLPTYSIGKAGIIHFAVHKSFLSLHIGISAVDYYKDVLAGYTITKSTVHLNPQEEIPSDLIAEIVQYNMVNGIL